MKAKSRQEYMRKYRAEHQEELNMYHRSWIDCNRQHWREYLRVYREKTRTAAAAAAERVNI